MAEVCQAVEHSNRNANTVLGLRQGTGQSIVCSGVPSPIVGSRIRHLQELMVKCHLCDHVYLFCRLSLAQASSTIRSRTRRTRRTSSK